MGIETLSKFIKEKCPDSLIQIPISSFSGTRIAIDCHNFMYRYYAIALKIVADKTDVINDTVDEGEVFVTWFHSIFNFLSNLLSHNINPIFVLDGIQPEEKQETKDERRQKVAKIKEEIAEIQAEIKKTTNIFSFSREKAERLRKLYSQCVYINSNLMKTFYHVVRGIGIPVLQAKGEGERLCCALFREGKVAAVYSADHDCLVHGVDILIKGISKEKIDGEKVFEVIYLPTLLTTLDIDFETFVKMCILSGCDYNNKIKKYTKAGTEAKNGMRTASIYKEIVLKGKINKLSKKEFKYDQCKIDKCLELFAPLSVESLIRETLTFDDSSLHQTSIESKYDPENVEVSSLSEKKIVLEQEDNDIQYDDFVPEQYNVVSLENKSKRELDYRAIDIQNLMHDGGVECLETIGCADLIGLYIYLLNKFEPCSDETFEIQT